jgi:fatty acid desaturase
LGHVVLWIVIPSILFGFWAALLYWLTMWSVVGVMLAMIFAPAHMGLPILKQHRDPWRLQLETTRNLVLPRWLSFFFIGLDYQVVHHLMANVPHQNMRPAAGIVGAWAAREGCRSLEIGYWEGLKDVTRFMHRAWDIPARDSVP